VVIILASEFEHCNLRPGPEPDGKAGGANAATWIYAIVELRMLMSKSTTIENHRLCCWDFCPGTTHHNGFNPNCTWRELVAVGVITPAVGEGSPAVAAYTTGLGVSKFAWLNKLKISARNSRIRDQNCV
jgi:hypothetical protein